MKAKLIKLQRKMERKSKSLYKKSRQQEDWNSRSLLLGMSRTFSICAEAVKDILDGKK